jgi:hypothetical protein
VPPVRLGITDSVNYATADQQMQLYWGDTLRARASVFDEVLTELAVRAWPEFGEVEVWHDFADVPALQAMEEARLKRVTMHIANGMEANAAYAYEGLTDAPKVEPPAPPVAPPVAPPPAQEPPPTDAPPPESAKASVPVEALFRAPEPAQQLVRRRDIEATGAELVADADEHVLLALDAVADHGIIAVDDEPENQRVAAILLVQVRHEREPRRAAE